MKLEKCSEKFDGKVISETKDNLCEAEAIIFVLVNNNWLVKFTCEDWI